MSDDTLQRLMDRASTDPAFRSALHEDTFGALVGAGVGDDEFAALTANNEEGLRRLMNADVSGYMPPRNGTCLTTTSSCLACKRSQVLGAC